MLFSTELLSGFSYFIVAPTIQQVRLPAWLNKWISEWEVKVTVQVHIQSRIFQVLPDL